MGYLRDPAIYRLYRSTFIERLEPEEAAVLEAALAAAEAKLRLMYQAVEYFVSDDPLFAVLHWTVATALGSQGAPNILRADALLAPGWSYRPPRETGGQECAKRFR